MSRHLESSRTASSRCSLIAAPLAAQRASRDTIDSERRPDRHRRTVGRAERHPPTSARSCADAPEHADRHASHGPPMSRRLDR